MLTILHTNDLHNKLSPIIADKVSELRRSAGPDVLLLDAGDAVGSGNITFRPGGEPILELMNRAGYDAMTVGNREFHVSRVGFRSKLSLARFPVLCANVRPAGSGVTAASPEGPCKDSDPPVQSYLVRELTDGTRVVIFGLTVPMVTERMLARKFSAYLFEDPLLAARRVLERVAATLKPDLVIAVTHIGVAVDRRLAETVPGIDLIVGGHTHAVLPAGERIGNSLIVQAGCRGAYIGRVEIDPARQKSGDRPMRASLEPL